MATIVQPFSRSMQSRASITLHVSIFTRSAILGRGDSHAAADGCKFDHASYSIIGLFFDSCFAADDSPDDEEKSAV